jgi:hypothetical protein
MSILVPVRQWHGHRIESVLTFGMDTERLGIPQPGCELVPLVGVQCSSTTTLLPGAPPTAEIPQSDGANDGPAPNDVDRSVVRYF